jgi:tetratricopeptide (TPR) repeat protein
MYGAFGGYLLSRSKWMGLVGLALLYPWLQFTVELTSIRVQEPFVLYRSYLWFPGMMLLFPLMLEKFPKRRTLFVLGFIVLLLVPLAWNRLWIFADNYRLWNDAAKLLYSEHEIGADRVFYNRGNAELENHDWDGAVNDFQRAVTLSPRLAQIHYGLGVAYENAKRYQDAVSQFDMAINIKPDDSSFFYAKGLTLKRLHQDDLAMRQMEKSCELNNTVACAIVGVSKIKN